MINGVSCAAESWCALLVTVTAPRDEGDPHAGDRSDRDRRRSAQGVLDHGGGRRRAAAAGTLRVPVGAKGYRQLRRFADRWPGATWAIEGASGLSAPLLARLAADGLHAVDVPAKLAARVRLLSSGHGRKNDTADAISVGIAALTAPQLHAVQVDQAVAALRALVEHRDDLVRARIQTVNRLHALLTQLIPAGAPTGLTAETAAQLLSRV